jgi:peptide/nickel transport system substrate-binding protein
MRVVGFAPANSDPAALATQPIGTGPFKLTEWVQNDHVTLEAFEDYWEMGEDGQPLPYLDGISVKFAPQEDTRIAALRAGQMDIALLSADGAARLANDDNLNIISGPEGVFTVIKMNKRFEPFNDVRVRKALDLALDKNAIIETALGGAGVLTGPIVYGWEDYGIAPEDLPYEQNLEEAKRLMAEAGYEDGFEVTAVTLPEGHAANFYPSIALAADAWKELGVTVNIEQLELGAWLEKNNTLDYDMLIGNRGFRGDPIDILYPHYHPKGSDNPIGYDNPEVTAWIEQAMVEPDRAKRHELYMKIQEQVLADVPWIFLWGTVENYAVQDYVKGYDHVAFDAYKDLLWTTWLDK